MEAGAGKPPEDGTAGSSSAEASPASSSSLQKKLATSRRRAFAAITFVVALAYADLFTSGLGCTSSLKGGSDASVTDDLDMVPDMAMSGDLVSVPDMSVPPHDATVDVSGKDSEKDSPEDSTKDVAKDVDKDTGSTGYCTSILNCSHGKICCALGEADGSILGECVTPAVETCGPQCPNGASQLCAFSFEDAGLECALADTGPPCDINHLCYTVSPPAPPVTLLDGASAPGSSFQPVCNYGP
jgi:hypothetical protein